MTEEQGLKKYISEIEKRYNRGSCSGWSNHHFTGLSADIEKQTGKRISDSTLKRILGKKKTGSDMYMPQMYTRDTLAEFLGYRSWDDFVSRAGEAPEPKATGTTGELQLAVKKKPSLWSKLVSRFSASNKPVTFQCANPKSRVPFTAVFHYDVSGIREDVMVDFGNGYSLPLPRDKHMITEFYAKAGFFDVILFTARNPRLATVRMHNLSKGWQGGTSSNDAAMTFRHFDDQSICRTEGRLYVSPTNLQLKSIDINSEFWTEYRYFDDLNLDLDNLTASIVAKNDPHEGGKHYNDIQVLLYGEHGRINFRFIAPDAHCYVDLEFGPKILSGRYNELSVFSRDTSDWRNVEIRTNNHTAEIFFEKEKVYTTSYPTSLGRFRGMIVRFYGCGSLRNAVLCNGAGMKIYESDFEIR